MRVVDAFRFASRVTALGSDASPAQPGIRSPWSASTLSKIAYSDIFGGEVKIVTRAEAMKVPAVKKGRALICGTLSRQPLAKFRGATKVASEAWMYRTNSQVPPQTRMLWTLDDLIFHGRALWAVERGTRGQILDAVRVPPDWWEIDQDTLEILVNAKPVAAREVIFFEGPQEGLLETASEDIRAARAMARAWANRVDSPVPLVELHDTDPNSQLEDEEIKDLTDSWEDARRKGGTAYTPSSLEVKTHGDTPVDLFVNGRNASRLDFANHLSLPGSLLDGSTATASLTYSTKEDSRNELVDLSLSFWATPIAARLSMDDVVPAGTRVDFDLEYLSHPTQPAQGPAHED